MSESNSKFLEKLRCGVPRESSRSVRSVGRFDCCSASRFRRRASICSPRKLAPSELHGLAKLREISPISGSASFTKSHPLASTRSICGNPFLIAFSETRPSVTSRICAKISSRVIVVEFSTDTPDDDDDGDGIFNIFFSSDFDRFVDDRDAEGPLRDAEGPLRDAEGPLRDAAPAPADASREKSGEWSASAGRPPGIGALFSVIAGRGGGLRLGRPCVSRCFGSFGLPSGSLRRFLLTSVLLIARRLDRNEGRAPTVNYQADVLCFEGHDYGGDRRLFRLFVEGDVDAQEISNSPPRRSSCADRWILNQTNVTRESGSRQRSAARFSRCSAALKGTLVQLLVSSLEGAGADMFMAAGPLLLGRDSVRPFLSPLGLMDALGSKQTHRDDQAQACRPTDLGIKREANRRLASRFRALGREGHSRPGLCSLCWLKVSRCSPVFRKWKTHLRCSPRFHVAISIFDAG